MTAADINALAWLKKQGGWQLSASTSDWAVYCWESCRWFHGRSLAVAVRRMKEWSK